MFQPHKWNASAGSSYSLLQTQKLPAEDGVSSFLLISLPLQLPLFLASPGLGLGGREPGGKATGSWCCSGHLALEPPGCGRYSNANSCSHWSSHGLLTIPHAGGLHLQENDSSSHWLPAPHTWGSLLGSVHYSGKPIFLRWAVQLPSSGSRSGSQETHTFLYKTTALS